MLSSSQHDVSHAASVVTAVAATPVFIFMCAVPALLLAAVQDTSAHVTVGMVSQQFAMLSTEVAPAAAVANSDSLEKALRETNTTLRQSLAKSDSLEVAAAATAEEVGGELVGVSSFLIASRCTGKKD